MLWIFRHTKANDEDSYPNYIAVKYIFVAVLGSRAQTQVCGNTT